MKKFQSVRGMKDILPNESKCFRNLENVLMSSANQFGFEEIKTPILEDTNLFIKSIGDGTDIIEKEMYTFVDAKNNSFSMRPEATKRSVHTIETYHAAIARACIFLATFFTARAIILQTAWLYTWVSYGIGEVPLCVHACVPLFPSCLESAD